MFLEKLRSCQTERKNHCHALLCVCLLVDLTVSKCRLGYPSCYWWLQFGVVVWSWSH